MGAEQEKSQQDLIDGLTVYQRRDVGKLDINNVNEEHLKAILYNTVQDTIGFQVDDLSDDLPLMQAGIASRTAVTLRANLEKEMPGVNFPATLVFDFPTIQGIVDFVMDAV